MGLRFISVIIMLFTGMQSAISSPPQQQKIHLKLKLNYNADIHIGKAALKYNKQLALSITLDDGYRSAFLCAYPLLNGGKVKIREETGVYQKAFIILTDVAIGSLSV